MLLVRVRFLAAMLAASIATVAFAQAKPEHGDETFQPTVGQPGKDVVWVPTPDALVKKMLDAAKVTKDDLVYDLGSGDGKIPIAAARDFGATAVGIEYNADMAELARRNVRRAGVEGRVTIITGDIFVENFSRATVVTMYLLPDLNLKLRPLILAMKPGTRVTSHQFHMGDWEPDERMKEEYRDAYLWIVPARVEGTWAFKEDRSGAEGTVSLVQRYQRVGGTVTLGGRMQPLLGSTIAGDKLSFTYLDADNSLRTARVTVAGDAFTGEVHGLGGPQPLTGRRQR